MTVSVLIVEDEPAFLQRFSEAVLREPRLHLCGTATTVAAGKALLDATAPDVVLTDLGLPDGSGVDLIRHAVAKRPDCDVLVITMFGDDAHVTDSIAAGATGYLVKDALPESITAAILQVHEGGSPISPAIARRVLQRFKLAATPADGSAPAAKVPAVAAPGADPEATLSERETEILRLVAKGLGFGEIAGVLAISQHTVVTHVKRIYRKLAVHSRGEAVYEAQSQGLI